MLQQINIVVVDIFVVVQLLQEFSEIIMIFVVNDLIVVVNEIMLVVMVVNQVVVDINMLVQFVMLVLEDFVDNGLNNIICLVVNLQCLIEVFEWIVIEIENNFGVFIVGLLCEIVEIL